MSARVARHPLIDESLSQRPEKPHVLRGAGAHWPALQRWDFESLAALAPHMAVQLVKGDRELGPTRFVASTLGEHLRELSRAGPYGTAPTALKEFDLLRTFPHLRDDLRTSELFPRGAVVSTSVWIGPSGARTGLHRDLLSNIAMVIRGRKCFHLAGPGSIESLGEMSDKHDRWAKLSRIGFEALAARRATTFPMQTITLEAGDALYVPAGWWHEVVTLEPSILLGGFFAGKAAAVGHWLATGARHALHCAGLWRKGNCTCHA